MLIVCSSFPTAAVQDFAAALLSPLHATSDEPATASTSAAAHSFMIGR